jgi:hypothetical protein
LFSFLASARADFGRDRCWFWLLFLICFPSPLTWGPRPGWVSDGSFDDDATIASRRGDTSHGLP